VRVTNKSGAEQIDGPPALITHAVEYPRPESRPKSRCKAECLLSGIDKSQQGRNRYIKVKNRMEEHQSRLVKRVAKELIATIPTTGI
jgi:hypothetical protein